MDTLKAELAEFQAPKDLKPVLAAPGPCLSVYIPLSSLPVNQSSKANALEWKEMLRSLEPKIEQYGSEGRKLLEGISDFNAIWPNQEPHGRSIGVLRSPDVFLVTWVEQLIRRRAVMGPRFYIRPLLPDVTRDRAFYLLALSKKNVRMLRCTSRTADEIAFPPGVVTNQDEYMNTAKPDHVRDNRATPGPSAGSSSGIVFGFGSVNDTEARDEYVAQFFRQIDRGINEILRGKTEPLVLCGVESELPIYRSINSYPHLAEESVPGAPNSLKSGEMHARALEAMARCYEHEVDEALSEYNHKVGSGASNRIKEVVKAAHDGRVLKLVVSDSLETTGAFNEATYTVKGRETGTAEDEDLVNDAVVQTILHAGQVLVARNGKMPNGTPVAAIFRFSSAASR